MHYYVCFFQHNPLKSVVNFSYGQEIRSNYSTWCLRLVKKRRTISGKYVICCELMEPLSTTHDPHQTCPQNPLFPIVCLYSPPPKFQAPYGGQLYFFLRSDRKIMQDTCSRTSDITFRLWKCPSLWSPTDDAAASTKGTELCCSPHYPYTEIRTHYTRVAAFTLAARSFATNLQSAFVYLLCFKWSDAGLAG